MFIYDVGNLFLLAVNDAFSDHYGYTKPEALALRMIDLYPESEKLSVEDRSKILNGEAYIGEWHHFKKDGTPITVEIRSHELTYTGRDARIVVVSDVSEREMMETALRENIREISLIYDTVGDVIFNLGVDGDQQYFFASVNRHFLSVTGLKADQIVGKRIEDVIPEPSLSFARKKYAEAIKEKKIVQVGGSNCAIRPDRWSVKSASLPCSTRLISALAWSVLCMTSPSESWLKKKSAD